MTDGEVLRPTESEFDRVRRQARERALAGRQNVQSDLARTLQGVSGIKPDDHAKALNLSRTQGIPVSQAQAALSANSKAAIKMDEGERARLIQEAPLAVKWLMDADNAAVSHDDIDGLRRLTKAAGQRGGIRGYIGDLGNGFARGMREQNVSAYDVAVAYGLMSPEEAATAAHQHKAAALANPEPDYVASQGFPLKQRGAQLGSAVNAMVENLTAPIDASSVGDLSERLGLLAAQAGDVGGSLADYGITFLGGGKSSPIVAAEQLPNTILVGETAGLGAIAGASAFPARAQAGAAAGATSGVYMGSAFLEVGGWLEQELGRKYDLTTEGGRLAAYRDKTLMASARAAGERKGITVGALEAFMGLYTGSAIKAAPAGAASKLVAGAKAIGEEILTEQAGEAASQAAAYKGDTSLIDWNDVALEGFATISQSIGQVLAPITVQAIADAALKPGAAGRAAQHAVDVAAKAIQAIQDHDTAQKAQEEWVASKAAQRAPERLRPLVQQAGGEAGIETVRIETDAWRKAVQAQGKSPAAELARVSPGASWEQAEETGEVVMPYADWIAGLAGDPAAEPLNMEARFRDGGQTLAESQQTVADIQDGLAEANEAAKTYFQEGRKLQDQADEQKAALPSAEQVKVDAVREAELVQSISLGSGETDPSPRPAGDRSDSGMTSQGPALSRTPEALRETADAIDRIATSGAAGIVAEDALAAAGIPGAIANPKQAAADLRELADIRERQVKAQQAVESIAKIEKQISDLADAASARKAEGDKLIEQYTQQLRDAGRGKREAQHDAALLVRMLSVLSERYGIPMDALSKRFGLTVSRETAPSEKPDAQGGTRGIEEGRGQSERRFNIALYDKANKSTFLHETAHYFLEVMGDLAAEHEALAVDHEAVRKWLGAKEGEALTEAQHEKWARGFERYLADPDKAVSDSGVRRMFAAMRDWLTRIYPDLKVLDVELTPEVRAVMDRLIATDDEIAQAQQEQGGLAIFNEKPPGWDEARWTQYQQDAAAVRDEANDALRAKLMEEVTAERKSERRDLLEQYTAEALAAFQKRPEAARLAQMQAKTGPKLNADSLERAGLSAAQIKALTEAGVVSDATGSLDAQGAAEAWGYLSVSDLADALVRASRAGKIAALNAAMRLKAEHPELRGTAQLRKDAKRAVASDAFLRLKLDELRGLLGQTKEGIAKAKREQSTQAAVEAGARVVAAEKALAAAKSAEFTKGRELGREEGSEPVAKLVRDLADAKRELAASEAAASMAASAEKSAQVEAAMSRRSSFDAVPTLATIREQAAATLAPMKLRDMKPHAYLSASARLFRKAADRARVGKFDEAAKAQTGAILNHELHRLSRNAKEQAAKDAAAIAKMGQDTRLKRMGKAGPTFRDRMLDVLQHYGLIEKGSGAPDPRGALDAWIAERVKELRAPTFDSSILAGDRTTLDALTADQLSAVRDVTEQIWGMAKDTELLLLGKKGETRDARQAEMAGSLAKARPTAEKQPRSGATQKEKDAKSVKAAVGLLSKVTSIAHQADGEKDGGAWWQTFVRPFNRAIDSYRERHGQVDKQRARLREVCFTPEQLKSMDTRYSVPGVAEPISHADVLMVLANSGNQGNRSRLEGVVDEVTGERKGGTWQPEELDAIRGEATAQDVIYAQGILDIFDGLRPDVFDMQERVTGLRPEAVAAESLTFKGKDGKTLTLRGGYFPIIYGDIKGEELTEAQKGEELSRAASGRAMTRHGHTEARLAQVLRPLSMDLSNIDRALDQVLYDLTHREALIDANAMLVRVKDDLIARMGKESYAQIKSLLSDIATNDTRFWEASDRLLSRLRRGTSAAILGAKAITATVNTTGIVQSVHRIGGADGNANGALWFGKAAADLFANPQKISDFIKAKSRFMAERAHNLTREQAEGARLVMSGKHDKAREAFTYYLYGRTQVLVDNPTWYGAYLKQMEANPTDEALAIDIADSVVREAQGSGDLIDMAAIQRGSEWKKWATIFYHYSSTTLAQSQESWRQLKVKDPDTYGRFLADQALLFAAPAAMTAVFGGLFAAARGDDDEDSFLKRMSYSLVSTYLGLIPIVRNAAGYGLYGRSGGPESKIAESLAAVAILPVFDAINPDKDVNWLKVVEGANMAAGIWYGYPADFINHTVEGFGAWIDGSGGPQSPVFGKPRR